jgi:hypothetical protein
MRNRCQRLDRSCEVASASSSGTLAASFYCATRESTTAKSTG